MTEPHDPAQPADRAPYEAPADDTRSYASPAGPPPPFPPQGPPPQAASTPPGRGLVTRRTLAATAAGALVVGGVVGGLIGWASTDSSQPVRTTTVAETQTPGGTHTQGEQTRRSRGVAGTITAINGSTWTIQTTKGDPFTVVVGPDTRFGTATAPAQASDFAVGDRIVATGTRSGTTVDATRVVKRVARSAPSSGAPSPTTAPS